MNNSDVFESYWGRLRDVLVCIGYVPDLHRRPIDDVQKVVIRYPSVGNGVVSFVQLEEDYSHALTPSETTL